MTDDAEDPDDDPDRDRDRPRGLFDQLRDLIEAIDDIDESDLDRDDVRVDFDYDVDVGLGDSGIERPGKSDARRRRSGNRDRSRTIDVDDLPGEEPRTYHVDVDDRGDEILVKADLPGATEDDVSVDVEDGSVRVVVDGETICTVPVDWEDGTVTDVSFANGVLVVTLSRPEDGGDDDGA